MQARAPPALHACVPTHARSANKRAKQASKQASTRRLGPLQVRIVQKLNLKPLEERIASMEGAGYNTFLLQNADVFLGALAAPHAPKGCLQRRAHRRLCTQQQRCRRRC